MNIESLRLFHNVATLKSISKVASASHISQSALSQQLSKMEENLGVTALIRSNKGVELTEEGKIINDYATEILSIYNRLIQELDKINSEKNSLIIETTCLSGYYILSKILSNSSGKTNNFFYDINYQTHKKVHSNLINNVCDISITSTKLTDSDCTSYLLATDKLVCVCNSSFKSSTFNNLPFLLLKDDLNIEHKINDFIDLSNIILKTDSLYTILSCLLIGPSIAILPKICVTNELKQGILKEIYIPELDNITYNLYLTHKNDINKVIKGKLLTLIRNFKIPFSIDN
ncbi:LysR family transcriptional regulator [uncultured Clostridium sp.]|uniref:LysR family transcriptional regulator n=1 Tax=uncultured Clostridium sp. TaxID=59620 RepID=UPI0025E96E74|nr:LysR family transcriptional regulator [uncultured Clostridium sp.]MDU4883197.1 LysR family transcriptional regulator [Clostridium celatum]MDU7076927.1 LysR family transcriptional regulator [Clostridium celatum]